MAANDYQFFWQKAGKQKSRFNLLLLEYGESFYEDLSVFWLPIPTSTRTLQQCDSLKTQGRLKVCSRSLIFEPNDIKSPIVRYCYKSFSAAPSVYKVSTQEQRSCMFESSGFISFACSTVFEMKANGKVGPYRQVDDVIAGSSGTANAGASQQGIPDHGKVLFALVHSEPRSLLAKVDALRQIYSAQNTAAADNIQLPYNTTAISSGFDTSLLVNFHETLRLGAPVAVKKVSPMIMNPGSIMITDSRIYYQPANINNVDEIVQSIDLHKIHRIFCRRFLLQQIGIELLMTDGSSVLLCFDDRSIRDHIYSVINEFPRLSKNYISLEEGLARWQRKEMTNFEYLMFLNYEAGRSNNDLTQYPVFPHILRDFTSKSLDFKAPETYRDLSLPVGALNPARLEHFKQRYLSMPAVTPQEIEEGMIPPFMYGTHYSTPGYALHYLVRVAPEHMLCLQAGKFDAPDRMFTSIEETWASVTSNPADLKELIPEFFNGTGEFLVNKDDLELGYKQSGERLGDVELPVWAKSPKDFIKKNVKALESSYVSNHIHEWIDLIFGYKQQGQAAVDANNVFYHLTYEGSVDWDKITSERERNALEIQIQEFGQTPRQLFLEPHPRRSDDPQLAKAVAVAPRLSPHPERHNMIDKTQESIEELKIETVAEAEAAVTVCNDSSRDRRTPSPIPTCSPATAARNTLPTLPPRPDSTGASCLRESESEGAVHLLDDNFKSAVARELNGIGALIVNTPPKLPDRRPVSTGSNAPGFVPSVAVAAATTSVPARTSTNNSSSNGKKNIFGAAVSNIYSFFGGKDTPSTNNGSAPLIETTPPRPTLLPAAVPSVSPVTVFYNNSNSNGNNNSGNVSRSASKDQMGGLDMPGILSQSREERVSSTSSSHSNPLSSGRRKRAGEVALSYTMSGERSVSNDGTGVGAGGFYMNSFEHDSGSSISDMGSIAENAAEFSVGVGGVNRKMSPPPMTAQTHVQASITPVKSAPAVAMRIALHALPVIDDSGNGSGGNMKTNLHGGRITCISARRCNISGSGVNRRASVLCSTCCRDGSIKVLQLDIEGSISRRKGGIGGQSVKIQTRRTFNDNASSASSSSYAAHGGGAGGGISCNSSLIGSDGKYLLAGCADSHLYNYSVPNAGIISKTPLHDDSISVMAVDDTDRMLVTGAIDASIKIWRLKEGGSMMLASLLPVSETFEHDNAITSLCISHAGTSITTTTIPGVQVSSQEVEGPCYMAAGAEDGVLIVWDIKGISNAVLTSSNATKDSMLSAFHQPTVMFSCQLGNMRRAVSAVQWIPVNPGGLPAGSGVCRHMARGQSVGFDRDKFICSTIDGHLVCMDAQGKLVLMSNMCVGIQSLAVESRSELHGQGQQEGSGCVSQECVYIYGGCSDGSLRVWVIEGGAFVEKYRVEHALRVRPSRDGGMGMLDYDPPVPGKTAVISCMCLCSACDLLITGGDTGAIRFWHIDSTPYVS